MEKILLFIPGYNCEKQIVRVLRQLDNEVMKYISKVIVVNNRSTDRTEEVVLSYIEKIKIPLTLLRNDDNFGLGDLIRSLLTMRKIMTLTTLSFYMVMIKAIFMILCRCLNRGSIELLIVA